MSLNDIRLTPTVAAALYRTSLIENNTDESIQLPEKNQPVTGIVFKYLGNNEKNILIVVNYSRTTHLPDEELSFLTNILSACKLTLGDVAIVNMHNHSAFTYKDFINHFKTKIVMLFGVDPVGFGLPIDFPHFQVQAFSNCNFLFSPPMEERHDDKLFKSKLWVSLQRIFGL